MGRERKRKEKVIPEKDEEKRGVGESIRKGKEGHKMKKYTEEKEINRDKMIKVIK